VHSRWTRAHSHDAWGTDITRKVDHSHELARHEFEMSIINSLDTSLKCALSTADQCRFTSRWS
jgi:hypothetical protein